MSVIVDLDQPLPGAVIDVDVGAPLGHAHLMPDHSRFHHEHGVADRLAADAAVTFECHISCGTMRLCTQ